MDCEGRNIELVREKEEALDELDDVKERIAALEAAIKDKDSQLATLQYVLSHRASLLTISRARIDRHVRLDRVSPPAPHLGSLTRLPRL